MLGRWLLMLALVIGLAVIALDLLSGTKTRSSALRTPSVADVVTARGEDPNLPQASAMGDTAPGGTPTISY
ncbi:MAG TPA: hypothetical protein VGL14_08610 [Methylomirabilota bacterium]|jgi:hypothetical protein